MRIDRELQQHLTQVISAAAPYGAGDCEIRTLVQDGTVDAPFHQWVDGVHLHAHFLLRRKSDDTRLHLLLMPWGRHGNEYLIVFPTPPSGPVAELREVDVTGEARSFRWRYSPKKRDGNNADRVAYFTRYFGSLDVIISVPEDAIDVGDFVSELFALVENRLAADALAGVPPIARSGFPEGKRVERIHLTRERDSRVVVLAKSRARSRDGRLACEACGFDFVDTYGEQGEGFIEAHHTAPLSELSEATMTTVEDLALLCANCHRMIHRVRPWLDVAGLRELLASRHR